MFLRTFPTYNPAAYSSWRVRIHSQVHITLLSPYNFESMKIESVWEAWDLGRIPVAGREGSFFHRNFEFLKYC